MLNISNLLSDLMIRGPFYALLNTRIQTQKPLDPVENWDFWTQPKSPWLERVMRTYPPEFIRKSYLNRMLSSQHSTGIEAHYDISNEFYFLFLDQTYRFYTCAEFTHDQESLEAAQLNKAKQLRALLQLSGQEKILDLGCGWGAMLNYLRDSGHNGELSGLTLSQQQHRYTTNVLGLNVSLSNFITDDFSAAPYDRILSIGALEHVRPQEIQAIYQKMYDALVPGGLSVHQFFSLNHEAYPVSMIMVQRFFPGSLLVLHDVHRKAAIQAGFEIIDDFTADYRPTLRAWYNNLVQHQEEALNLVGLEVYNRYLTFFPVSWLFFQQQEATLHRIALKKPT